MKTELPNNGARQVVQAREHHRGATAPDYEQNGSGRIDDAGDRSGKAKKQSLFQMPDLGSVRDAAGSSRKRIFAIVSRPIPSDVEGKTIRRILLFDNHPDSLRLVLKPCANLDSDDEAKFRRERRTSIICGSILIAMVVAAMLWPLLW